MNTALRKYIERFFTSWPICWRNSGPVGEGFCHTAMNGGVLATSSVLAMKNVVTICRFRLLSALVVYSIDVQIVGAISRASAGSGGPSPAWLVAARITAGGSTNGFSCVS